MFIFPTSYKYLRQLSKRAVSLLSVKEGTSVLLFTPSHRGVQHCALSLSTLFRGWITIKIPERIKYQARWEVLFISHFAGGMFTRFSSSLLVLKLPARDTNPLIHVSDRRSAAGGDLTRKKSSSFIYQNSHVVSPSLNAVFNLISNSLSVLALRPNNIIPFNQWLINGVE